MVETVWLESERIRVGVTPDYGARVTHLVDRRTGRDWIAPGAPSANTGEDAVYLAAEAVGWDECFPTIARSVAGAPWNRRLRDHGDLWGRPWRTLSRSATELATAYDDPLFTFTRRLRCEDDTLSATYEVQNLSAAPMPYLWAMHLLLAVQPEDRIDLGNVGSVEVDFLSLEGRHERLASLAWPDSGPVIGFDIDTVQPAARRFAAKLYVAGMPRRSAHVGNAEGGLTIGWSAPWNSLGIWLTYGGWPADGAVHHIAIEPTTRPTDNLDPTTNPALLQPGERIQWSASLSVGDRASRSSGGNGK